MDDDRVLRQADRIVDVEHARARAEVVSSFYRQLRKDKVPELAAREFTCLEFYANDVDIEWDD